MEVINNNESNVTNASGGDGSPTSEFLPDSVTAFAPLVLIELVAAVVSNTLLIALIVKASLEQVQNNTNIYLFSLGILGLIESFNLFTLFVTVSARRWVFGSALCYINNGIMNLHLFCPLFLHFVISRDRYKAVRDPFHWQPMSKWSYISTVVIWALAIAYGVFKLLDSVIGYDDGERFFSCYFRNIHYGDEVIILVLSVLYYVLVIGILVSTLTYYILILKDLHLTEQLRVQRRMLPSHMINVNGRDKPIECTGEERAARSLALIFLIQFAGSLLSSLLASYRLFESLAKDVSIQSISNSNEIALWFALYLFPAVNPTFLILTNKRFRSRVLGLFKWELRTTTEIEGNAFGRQLSSEKLENKRNASAEKRLKDPTLLFVKQQDAEPRKANGELCARPKAGEGDFLRSSSLETCSTLVGSRQSIGEDELGREITVREAWVETACP